jgi:2,3-bisphosphoglycerate-independent phosphoglycerate mutase
MSDEAPRPSPAGSQHNGPDVPFLPAGPETKAIPLDSVLLVVLDGWGLAPPGPGNAVSLADTPVFDSLWQRYPHTQLDASGPSVGLPEGQMGNSEVGHLNLGAGAVVKQDLVRIDDAISDGSFFENAALKGACAFARESGRLHLAGLVSDGGVHSDVKHLRACIELAERERVPELLVHAFTDGRDTSPTSSPRYLAELEQWLASVGSETRARVATVVGRYWAMDRDRRWDRTKRTYDMLVRGEGEVAESSLAAIEAAYGRGETDEFIQPTVISTSGGGGGTVRSGDSVLFFNFRPDRMRQLTMAFGEESFEEFARVPVVRPRLTTMTQYHQDWTYPVAFPPAYPPVTLAKILADSGARQLHVAETEKYPHVTYFFNGGQEDPYPGEERCLVPSPRDVPTYDHKPEMSAEPAAEQLSSRWREAYAAGDPFRFGIINFANPDMVGHTGSIPAATRAVEIVDRCLGRVVEAVHETGGALIVTADHGNADEMLTPDGAPDTAHSKNPVPLILTVGGAQLRPGGILADIAPTAVELLGLEQPPEMTGRSLLARAAEASPRPA